jgi:protein-S-isoprenylcysteine O-methyltransferase Ste14
VMLHLLWHLAISIEERSLAAQFGQEYLDYASRTGRFIPRLFPLRGRAWPIA